MAQADVRSIEALRELRGSLVTFREEAYEAMESATREHGRALEHLQGKYDAVRMRAQEYERKLQEAQEALRRCQAAGSRDNRRAPDCTQQALAVRDWQRALDAEREKMARLAALLRQVNEAAEPFLREARRLNEWLQRDLEQGRARLDRSIQQLESYTGTRSTEAAIAGAIGAAAGMVLAAGAAAAIGGAAAMMKGSDGAPARPPLEALTFDDWSYGDGKGRALVQRVYRNGDDLFSIRLFDEGNVPDRAAFGLAQANCQIEDTTEGRRLRLQDIIVPEALRGAGNGAHLLERVEEIGRTAGASEVYGTPPDDDETLAWYGRRGWGLSADRTRIFKLL